SDMRPMLNAEKTLDSGLFLFSPDSARVAWTGSDVNGGGELHDVTTGALLRKEILGDYTWSPSGRLFASALSTSDRPAVSVRDGRTGSVLRTISLPAAISPSEVFDLIMWGSDEVHAVVTRPDGFIAIIDALKGTKTVLRKPMKEGRQDWAALSP